jgi:hypothetical protein
VISISPASHVQRVSPGDVVALTMRPMSVSTDDIVIVIALSAGAARLSLSE